MPRTQLAPRDRRETRAHVRDTFDFRLTAQLPLGADFACDASNLRRKRAKLIYHFLDGLGGPQEFALQRTIINFERHGLGEIALRDGADNARRLAGWMLEAIDQRIMDSIDPRHNPLTFPSEPRVFSRPWRPTTRPRRATPSCSA